MTEASIKQHDPLWDIIVAEAHQASSEEPLLTDFFRTSILNWSDLESALSYSLAHQLASPATDRGDCRGTASRPQYWTEYPQ